MLSIEFKAPQQILTELGERAKVVRLRLNMSRKTLSERSGVPESSIKRFEVSGLISSVSLVAILMALDRVSDLDAVLAEPFVPSIRELHHRKRQRGRA